MKPQNPKVRIMYIMSSDGGLAGSAYTPVAGPACQT